MIVETEQTLEQAEKMLVPAPAGRYLLELTGFKVGEDGTPDITFESGNKGMTGNLRIIGEGPTLEAGENFGKTVKPYNAVKGTGLMAQFKAAFPKANMGTGFDTDTAIGMRCLADVKVTTFEGMPRNEVKRLYPLPVSE